MKSIKLFFAAFILAIVSLTSCTEDTFYVGEESIIFSEVTDMPIEVNVDDFASFSLGLRSAAKSGTIKYTFKIPEGGKLMLGNEVIESGVQYEFTYEPYSNPEFPSDHTHLCQTYKYSQDKAGESSVSVSIIDHSGRTWSLDWNTTFIEQ